MQNKNTKEVYGLLQAITTGAHSPRIHGGTGREAQREDKLMAVAGVSRRRLSGEGTLSSSSTQVLAHWLTKPAQQR